MTYMAHLHVKWLVTGGLRFMPPASAVTRALKHLCQQCCGSSKDGTVQQVTTGCCPPLFDMLLWWGCIAAHPSST